MTSDITINPNITSSTAETPIGPAEEGAEPLGRMLRSILNKFKKRSSSTASEGSLDSKESHAEKLERRELRLHYFVKIRDNLLEKIEKEGKYSDEDKKKMNKIKRKINLYKRAIKGELALQAKAGEFKLDKHGAPLELEMHIEYLKKQIHEHQETKKELESKTETNLSEDERVEIQEKIEKIKEEISQKKIVARELKMTERLDTLERGEKWEPKNQNTGIEKVLLKPGSKIMIQKSGKISFSKAFGVDDSGRNHTEL